MAAAAAALAAEGSSHKPPNSPSGRRRAKSKASPRMAQIDRRCRTCSSATGVGAREIGSSFWMPRAWAWQRLAAATGHSKQRGSPTEQIVAPSSIKPWFSSPASYSAGSCAINVRA
jgi:hypothetical protein